MGYRLNGLGEPVFILVSKPLLTEFGIHLRLESCGKDFIPFAIAAACSRIQDGYLNLLFQMQYRFIA